MFLQSSQLSFEHNPIYTITSTQFSREHDMFLEECPHEMRKDLQMIYKTKTEALASVDKGPCLYILFLSLMLKSH